MSACLHDTGRDNIFIGGFMCSGKTSVGSELARRLGWTFTDTDRVIEERAGMTVPEIFSTLGEPAFGDTNSPPWRAPSREAARWSPWAAAPW